MPRLKFQTLTEQMFYILLCLKEECCGIDIMDKVSQMTDGRVKVGSGTLYNLLEQFLSAGMIAETKAEGRRRSYVLTDKGREVLETEYQRLRQQTEDYKRLFLCEEKACEEKACEKNACEEASPVLGRLCPAL
ncbi:MAG: PadR family transcriptional regulator [Clostridia bacterium]|nr:PadR family transcriptional regulator [Clostridia bacterium]